MKLLSEKIRKVIETTKPSPDDWVHERAMLEAVLAGVESLEEVQASSSEPGLNTNMKSLRTVLAEAIGSDHAPSDIAALLGADPQTHSNFSKRSA
jgi:hypothetical protein